MAKSRNGRDLNAIFLLDKPLGLSSNHALQRVKRLFKANKAGHTGSLDPLATGMLPICFGKATKLSNFLLNADKKYAVSAKLGEQRSTADAEGEVIATATFEHITMESLQAILKTFKGKILQIPPMYSALKKDGKPLYKLARQGVTVEREAREVEIYDIRLVQFSPPYFSCEVHCSKGTYIRTLIEDIAKALGSVAFTESLRRLSVGQFLTTHMISMDMLEQLTEQGKADSLLLSLASIAKHWPQRQVNAAQAMDLKYGRRIALDLPAGAIAQIYSVNGHFLGIIQSIEQGGAYKFMAW